MGPETRIFHHVGARLEAAAHAANVGRRMLAVCEAAPHLLAQLDALERNASELAAQVHGAADHQQRQS